MNACSEDCLSGGGEMGALMRSIDWSRTKLGPVAAWPRSLKTMVGVVLGNRFPMLLWWGPELLQLYNDAYRLVLGMKHPASMGAPGAEVWAEIWDVIGPMARSVLDGGPATWSEHLLLPMNRRGFIEETYFTFSYSPVPGDAERVGGVLVTVQETTEQVLDARQLRMLRDLAARSAHAKSAEEACRTAVGIFAANDADLPFSLLYLVDGDGREARLAGASGLDGYEGAAKPARVALRDGGEDAAAKPARVALRDGGEEAATWPLAEAARAGGELLVDDLAARFGALPGGRWDSPPERALILPVARPGQPRPYGFLVAGVSPRRVLGEPYRGLFRLITDQVATAIGNARAYEEERRRAEELAAIDRAKTLFFSNVSHEFRTPLTLLLGPLEDALASPERALSGGPLAATHRNALRLLKLVNALLDFSRIEAGRAEASYEPTDLAALTADLASAFRSAIERAGLAFVVDCPALPEPVFVDRDLWEKIVLNLLSNALKFTFEGGIAVSLRCRGDHVELVVRDSGTGIPAHELPRIFERFHRVQGARSRTHEGSGIGLALVHEVVRLHGGKIRVESRLDQGTAFTITIPRGSAHLPSAHVGARRTLSPTATGAAPYVQEALRWLPDAGDEAAAPQASPGAPEGELGDSGHLPARILLADDNADMRAYVRRILGERWTVDAVGDGFAAVEAARRAPPDLVVADVMMPGLDGFGVLRALRADPATRGVPVILLSARAGEESRVEGLAAGADDYIVKPFSARELVARVTTHLQIAALRRKAESANRAKDEFLAMLGHELRNPLSPIVTALHLMRLRAGGVAERERLVIERQVQHLTALVDDLLDISRITRGKIELKRQRVEIAEVVAKAIEQTSPLLERRLHRLSIAVPSRGLAVNGDVTRLAQVVSNLLTNAAKYTDSGGAIAVEAERRGREIVLRVRDSGIGIAPEVLPTIFDLFVQERQALDRAQGGLGLGLAIVRSLVVLHGGSVSAHSEGPGRGSEFTVRLPADRAAPEAAAELAPPQACGRPEPTSSGRRRLLLVDDNRDAAELLADALHNLGYVLRVAHDGPTALRVAEEFLPELALLDIGLPVMDGYELARRLRERLGGGGIRLIAVTGYGQETDRRRSEAAGFDAHLVKPIQIDRLEALLAELYGPGPSS